jgi:hypothetical protein
MASQTLAKVVGKVKRFIYKGEHCPPLKSTILHNQHRNITPLTNVDPIVKTVLLVFITCFSGSFFLSCKSTRTEGHSFPKEADLHG